MCIGQSTPVGGKKTRGNKHVFLQKATENFLHRANITRKKQQKGHMPRIRKKPPKFIVYMMRMENSENFTLSGRI